MDHFPEVVSGLFGFFFPIALLVAV